MFQVTSWYDMYDIIWISGVEIKVAPQHPRSRAGRYDDLGCFKGKGALRVYGVVTAVER